MEYLASFLLQSNHLLAISAWSTGVLSTVVIHRIINKRSTLSYFVQHNRVGISADDAIFGEVRITWNGTPVENLYSSSIELANESLNDLENVIVRIFSNDTLLLTERTELLGSIVPIAWTENYSNRLSVPSGGTLTSEQFDLHSSQREYLIAVFNRGQICRFHYLNTAKPQQQPTIWMDITHKGAKLNFQVPKNKIYGIEQPLAAIVGCIMGFIFAIGAATIFKNVWIVAFTTLIFGLIAQIPGVLAVKLWRWVYKIYAN